MADETQSWPLAPSKLYRRSDEENPTFKTLRKERTNKCFVYIFAFVVLLSGVALTFSLIALRSATPHVELVSVRVRSLAHGSSSFNATLVAELSIRNPNFGPYEFEGNNTALFAYNGTTLGERKVAKGSVGLRGTTRVNMTLQVGSTHLPSEGPMRDLLRRDLSSGVLNLTSYSKFTGRVHLISVLKNRRTAKMNCTMTLVINTSQIKNLRCD